MSLGHQPAQLRRLKGALHGSALRQVFELGFGPVFYVGMFLFKACILLPRRASPLVLVLLLGRGQLLAAVLADVAGMARSALLPVHWEAQEVPLGPALLCWGASVFEGVGEPLELSLMLALAYLSVCSRTASPLKTSLAPTAHEDATVKVRVHFMLPLVLARLLGGAPRPLPASVGRISESAGSRARDTYMRLTSSFRSLDSE